MRPKFLPEGAIRLGDTLIIADLHVGLEEAMLETGVYAPSLLDEMISSLRELMERENVGRLVIDGDIKHSFAPSFRERLRLREFVEEMKESANEIVLVRGNHDVGVDWLGRLGVEIADSLELGGWKVIHGHRPERGGRFIIGHEHPSVTLRDEVGATIKRRVFLKGEKLVVLPAFSPWVYGNDVTRNIVSPLLQEFDASEVRVLVPLGDELLNFGRLDELVKALRELKRT